MASRNPMYGQNRYDLQASKKVDKLIISDGATIPS